MSELGLYVHFPWCVKKCPYCDFNSHPLRGSLDEAGYLDALLRDAEVALATVAPGSIDTVFFGGGTPSLFSPAAFARLLDALAPYLGASAEVTMEANPGTTEHHDFAGYLEAGINRLSLGAQSFDDRQLSRLGRVHHAADTIKAYRKARAAGFGNINLDLMYGLPQQTVAQALADLDQAFKLAPEHISWYQLTLEAKTEFARRPPRLPGETSIVRMEEEGHALLDTAGYRRYEISAYARQGAVCRHNINYWSFGDYVGIGAGAHGKLSSMAAGEVSVGRTTKPSQPRIYLADPTQTEKRAVAKQDLVFEFLMNALRMTEGVTLERFTERTGLLPAALAPDWTLQAARGLVRHDRVAATPLGLRHLDALLQCFLR